MRNIKVSGLNIQQPWAQLILNNKKKIETRFYKIPEKHKGQMLAIIETPGSSGKFKARIIGLVVFSDCFQYDTKKQFILDESSHLVSNTDPNFSWKSEKKKWGWKVEKVIKLKHQLPAPKKRGIVFCNSCLIPLELLEKS